MTEQVIWAAHRLFERKQTPGTTGNISYREGDKVFVSPGGSCFGTLQAAELCPLALSGAPLTSQKPSKEWPLHLMLHNLRGSDGVVIHTHGFYTAAWSCLPCEDPLDAVPAYTPYLRMKAGAVRAVPYEKPGSQALFEQFRAALDPDIAVYLLSHHGAVVSAPTAMEAFNLIEEMEDSCRLALMLRGSGAETLP